MELSFVANAIRRRPWIVVLCMLLGLVPGILSRATAETKYESLAVILVSPPSEGQQNQTGTGTDRYVENQLSILQGTLIAEQVSADVGTGLSRKDVQAAVLIQREPGSDLVDVFASDLSPDRAQAIAQSYVDNYLDGIKTRAKESQSDDIDTLNSKITDLQEEIAVLDGLIKDAMAVHIPDPDKNYAPGEPIAGIPTVDMVAPAELSKKQFKQDELSKALDNITQLELTAKLKVTSEIVQNASLPTIPTGGSKSILLPLGLIGGAILGAVVAAFAARLSPKVLDASQVSQVLQQSTVGSFGRDRSLAKQPTAALSTLPIASTAVIDELSVRAEGNAAVGRALTVAVVGSQRNAGTTTLALAMAGRFANHGSKVLLVDADTRRSVLSRLFNTTPQTSIPKMISELSSGRTSSTPVIMATGVAEVGVVGLGDKSESTALRRETIPLLLEAAAGHAEVIVIDGGPVLDSATTLHLCNVVDAVVLAVPIKNQRGSALAVVRQQLANRRGVLLPVLTHPSKRKRGGDVGSSNFAPTDAAVSIEVQESGREVVSSGKRRAGRG